MTLTNISVSKIDLPPQLKKAAPYFLFVFAILLAYGNVYENGFLYDDESLILRNKFITDWHFLGSIFTMSITAGANIAGGFYRPLQILLYLLLDQAFGLSSLAFHFLNVALHIGNVCLLYRLGQKLRFNSTASFFAILIWALHPIQVEAITYMSGTADPLYVFFCLIGLLIVAPRFKPRQIAASIPFFILGLLSKEEAIVFPLLVMTTLFLLDKERFHFKTYRRVAPLWLISALYYIARTYFLTFSGFQLHQQNDLYATSVLCRIYTFLATLPHYIGFVFWPFHLHYDRDFPIVTVPWHISVLAGALIVCLAVTQIALGRSRRAIAFSWGLLWFAAAHLLHSGILVPVNASLLEHWLYLPAAGLFLGTAQSLASVKWQRKERKPFEKTFFTLLALFLGFLSYQQNKIWHDAEHFYLNIFKNGEPSPHAHNNLGIIYTLDGRFPEALEQYELSIELSGDKNAQSEHDLAITLLLGPNGDSYVQEAERHLKKALEIDPDFYAADEALAALADKAGDKDQADYYRAQAAQSHAKVIGP